MDYQTQEFLRSEPETSAFKYINKQKKIILLQNSNVTIQALKY